MFDIRRQEQRINQLQASIQAERDKAAGQLRTLMPQVRRATVAGSLLWSARKALPLLQPVAFGLGRKALGKFGLKGLAAPLGLAVLAFGAWRWLRPPQE